MYSFGVICCQCWRKEKKKALHIRIEETWFSYFHLKLPKSVRISFADLEKNPYRNMTKPHCRGLHQTWIIVVFQWFVMNYFSWSYISQNGHAITFSYMTIKLKCIPSVTHLRTLLLIVQNALNSMSIRFTLIT